MQAQRTSGLGDGVALFSDKLDSLDLELAGVGASDFYHDGPPKSEFTLLTGCPPFVGRSITCSMSRRADCWDNAPMESFFASLKKELIHDADFATREEAQAAIFA